MQNEAKQIVIAAEYFTAIEIKEPSKFKELHEGDYLKNEYVSEEGSLWTFENDVNNLKLVSQYVPNPSEERCININKYAGGEGKKEDIKKRSEAYDPYNPCCIVDETN